jgi:hypothetical protein
MRWQTNGGATDAIESGTTALQIATAVGSAAGLAP